MCLISLKVAGPDFGNREGAKNTITDVSAFSPQLVTCRGQAICYVEGVDTICSRYRVSKRPDQVSGFFVVPKLWPVRQLNCHRAAPPSLTQSVGTPSGLSALRR